ncbi:MAG TPA: PxKF domain-containing protein [Gemmatimonadales bacterium]|nr:PxKF domain-containing protein [Gemmatimonadales bacterium]
MAYSLSTAASVTGPSVLILADTDVVATSALATSLSDAGLQVTLRPAPEWSWDGTNPSLDGFDVVVHLNGATYDVPLPSSAQTALTNFVQNGGGFVASRWNGLEPQFEMAELVLQDMGHNPSGPEQNCGGCQVTYERTPAGDGHPVLQGLPTSFTFTADGNDAGPQIVFASDPSSVLMQLPSGGPAVLVRQFAQGRVVNFSFAANYYWNAAGEPYHDPVTLLDPTIQQLYLNAVQWAAGSGSGTAQPQTITFDAIADKVYGDAPFTISPSSSSGLPVTLTASGGCSVLGTTVSINAAGSCTITASQAGNDDYMAAEDVSQSFSIHQATPVISWTPASLTAGAPLGAAQLNATATGVGGVSLSGSFVYNPAAGTMLTGGNHVLSVVFTPESPNYRATQATAIVTVNWSAIVFKGFFAPVKNLPAVNVLMAGSAVPIKFTVGGYRGQQVLGQSPRSVEVTCPAGTPETIIRPGIAASSGLRSLGYSYTYVWKTNPSWAGTCRKFILTLIDGSVHEALFRFAAAPRTVTVKRIF